MESQQPDLVTVTEAIVRPSRQPLMGFAMFLPQFWIKKGQMEIQQCD